MIKTILIIAGLMFIGWIIYKLITLKPIDPIYPDLPSVDQEFEN